MAKASEEPLTGRKVVLTLYPVSHAELARVTTRFELEKSLNDFLIYGYYPSVVTTRTFADKESLVREISNSYLLKDILAFDLIKDSRIIRDLLKLLAFQIGKEVSLTKIGNTLGIDKKTSARYLHLLEKSFVVFRIDGFSRNLRKEINKMSKYYF